MSGLVCPVCGREGRGVCLDCFLEKRPIEFKELNLTFCNCGKVRSKDAWLEYSDWVVKDLVKHSLRASRDVVVENMKVSVEGDTAHITLDVIYEGKKGSKTFDLPITRSSSTCISCSRIRSSYYEAVLQVRGEDLNFHVNKDYLMKADKVRGGADYYMTSMNYAKQKAHEFLERGYFVRESSKLVGQKDGADLYRVYVSVRHPDFNPGDVVQHKGKLFRVVSLGRLVRFTEVDTRKSTTYPINALKDSKVVVSKGEVRKGNVTEVRPDGVQVMDAESFQNYELPKAGGMKEGDEVEFILISGRMRLL
ncbi:MAG: NMD3-related protein [Candidatus Altiarchaeota archaeon]|nr:NMD3-related protein [Candidatus Altiarchaeota archaeon]